MNDSTMSSWKRTVFKYELDLNALNQGPRPIAIEDGAEPLTVDMQYGRLCLWARVDPRVEKKDRRVYLVGTGFEAPVDATYVGTVLLMNGSLVVHAFIETR